jgi:succinoglycan biosynthesis protein ExoM
MIWPAGARLTVARFCATAPFPVYYVHEPICGIARARNAALDKATELGADWIAMLDDDEVADPRWLANLMAPEYLDTPVLMGKCCSATKLMA